MDPTRWTGTRGASARRTESVESCPGAARRLEGRGEFVSAVGRRMGCFVLEAFIEGSRDAATFRARRVMGSGPPLAAVKLLRTASPEPGIARLLDEERRSLDWLDHPAIPRLLGAGTTPDGWSWFAQEHVLGWPLHRYAEDQGLGLEERVRLMIPIYRAVEHAHERKVLHPELHPSSLMVTTRGEPKVVGFGLPGLPTGRNLGELGPLLFSLLLPVRPFLQELRSGDGPGISLRRRLVPPRPRGDIDRVCLQAVGEEHWELYASAGAVADDLERVLGRIPVAARRRGVAARIRTELARIPWSRLVPTGTPSPSRGR